MRSDRLHVFCATSYILFEVSPKTTQNGRLLLVVIGVREAKTSLIVIEEPKTWKHKQLAHMETKTLVLITIPQIIQKAQQE